MTVENREIYMPSPQTPIKEFEEISQMKVVRSANELLMLQESVERALNVDSAKNAMKHYDAYRFDHRLSSFHLKRAKSWPHISRIEDEKRTYAYVYEKYRYAQLYYNSQVLIGILEDISSTVLNSKSIIRNSNVRTGKDLHGVCVIYPPAELLRSGIDELISFLQYKTTKSVAAVAVIATYLLALHPFSDGNGRVMRILTNLTLERSPATYIPFSELNALSRGGYGIRCRIAAFSNNWSEIIYYYSHLFLAVELDRVR